METIIFTDLDGTLLNHDDYSFEDAKEALAIVLKKNIPLIFTTSKTKKEVELLQKKLNINEPFIIENGAAIFFPKDYKGIDFSFLDEFEDYYIYQLGLSYNQILNFYNRYKNEFEILGFSDMSDNEIIKYTQLSATTVKYSKQRDFTEPFLIKDENKIENLKNLASTYNIKITRGGRFYHLIGEKQNKGYAVLKCIDIFEKIYQNKVRSIALGDGENDISMLEKVTIPIAIQNHNNEYIDIENINLQKSTYKGSKGWNEMVKKNV